MEREANYCPSCGEPVASARTIAVDQNLPVTGTFANPDDADAHVVLGEGHIDIYEHADGDAA